MILVLSGAVLLASLLFGGGTGRSLATDLLPQLLGLVLIAAAAPQALPRLRQAPFLAALLAGLIALPLLQLIPLPPALWGALPGRAPVLQTFHDAGLSPPWLGIALRPGEAWRSLFALVPGLALFLAGLGLDGRSRRILLWLAIGVGAVSVPLGMLQALGGSESPLDFYAGDGPAMGRALGFFANPNHFATFLSVLIPVTVALLASAHHMRVPPTAIGAGLVIVLLLGLSLTGSRSVLVLGLIALLASLALVPPPALRASLTGRRAWLLAGVGLALLMPLALGMGLLQIFERVAGADVADDHRWTMARVTAGAIPAYFPFGVGLGAFEAVYQRHETVAAVIHQLVNHAHNDWLEFVLETGLAGAALQAAWLVWLCRASLASAKSGERGGDLLARAALIGLWLVSLHSLWDYPLRTIALAALVGLLVSLTQKAPAADPAAAPGAQTAWRWRKLWPAQGSGRKRRRRSRRRGHPGPAAVG